MEFSDSTLRSVTKLGRRYVVSDSTRPGFAIKVSALGQAQFYHRRSESGKRKDIPLGTDYTKALKEYQIYHRLSDPASPTRLVPVVSGDVFITGLTLPQLCAKYLKDHVLPNLSRSSERSYTYFLDLLIAEAKGNPLYTGKGTVDQARLLIKQLIRDTRDAGKPVLCNRMRSCYSSMFKWAVEEDLVADNPMYGMPTAKERPKSRRFDDTELGLFLHTLDSGKYNQGSVAALKIILLTGCRPGEVLAIRAPSKDHPGLELDKSRCTLFDTKNGKDHLLALPEAAVALLRPLVAVSRPGARLVPVSSFGLRQVALRAAKRACITGCTPHDLRRTFATTIGSLGVPMDMIQRLLNHSSTSVTAKHYALYEYEVEKRAACEVMAKHLVALRHGQEI